jgi:hypothetical protein
MFKVARGAASTEISYMFRLNAVNPHKSRAQKEADAAAE